MMNTNLTDSQRIAGLRASLNILTGWKCTTEEKCKLLGLAIKDLPDADEASMPLTEETMERISVILGIHASLRTLFSSDTSVRNWVRTSNSSPTFGGQSAMAIMLGQGSDGIWLVQRFLTSQLS